jgi:hypothetical protein
MKVQHVSVHKSSDTFFVTSRHPINNCLRHPIRSVSNFHYVAMQCNQDYAHRYMPNLQLLLYKGKTYPDEKINHKEQIKT